MEIWMEIWSEKVVMSRGLIRNRVVDALRAEAREREMREERSRTATREGVDLSEVTRLTTGLTTDEIIIVWSRFWEGLSLDETASRWGWTRTQVRRLMRTAMAKMRRTARDHD